MMLRPRLLRLTSCQAPNSEFIGRAISTYLANRLGLAVEFVDDVPWQERELLLDSGEVHAGWICGLTYALKRHVGQTGLELLAAPVTAGARYLRRPVYFSDVVVRSDSTIQSFADLRGASWGYNEPGSHSGFNIVRFQLAQRGELGGYFGDTIETGSHEQSLAMIEEGVLDASAIDSTVLETEVRRRPELARLLRVVEIWGPSPAPPWVVSRRLMPDLRRALRQVLLSMHREPAGRALLRQACMVRFAGVRDFCYDSIREMASAARIVTLTAVQPTYDAGAPSRALTMSPVPAGPSATDPQQLPG
jgi:phosphonate transport system substrate-binding protein